MNLVLVLALVLAHVVSSLKTLAILDNKNIESTHKAFFDKLKGSWAFT